MTSEKRHLLIMICLGVGLAILAGCENDSKKKSGLRKLEERIERLCHQVDTLEKLIDTVLRNQEVIISKLPTDSMDGSSDEAEDGRNIADAPAPISKAMRDEGDIVFKAPKKKMQVQGNLSREAIAKVVRRHLRKIQVCYEKNLLINPKLAGKVVIEWTITPAGSVAVVKVRVNTMESPTVALCILKEIKTWRFPKPEGGPVVVSYPFVFNSIGF